MWTSFGISKISARKQTPTGGVGQVCKKHLRALSHVKCGKAIRGHKASKDGLGLVTAPKDFPSQTICIPIPEVQLNADQVCMGTGLQQGEVCLQGAEVGDKSGIPWQCPGTGAAP